MKSQSISDFGGSLKPLSPKGQARLAVPQMNPFALASSAAKTAALDTNVLARYLESDDAAQFTKAQRLIALALTRNEPLPMPISVPIELEWVLRSRQELAKTDLTLTLDKLPSCGELAFGRESSAEQAQHFYQQSNADFAGCSHMALAFCAHQLPRSAISTGEPQRYLAPQSPSPSSNQFEMFILIWTARMPPEVGAEG